MKQRIIRAFSVVCVSCLMFSVCQRENDNQNNNTTTAGIISASTVDFNTVSEPVVTDSNVVATASGDTQLYGYTNLGIANVEGNINIRQEPSEDGSIVGKLPENAGCEIVGVEGEWTHITSGEVEGYVMSGFLLTGEDAKTRADEVAQYLATVTVDSLRVRLEPNTTSEILSTLREGSTLEIVENQGEWVKVNIDNEEGYVSGEFVTCEVQLRDAMTLNEVRFGEGVSDARIALVSEAVKYVGNPYVWGGTSLTRGADCSGFVLSLYAQYGIYLPHSSRAQANCGRRVSTAELKPGDLLFYGSGGGINHVAMYIGGGQIVHASTPRTGIIISSAFNRSPICCVSLLD